MGKKDKKKKDPLKKAAMAAKKEAKAEKAALKRMKKEQGKNAAENASNDDFDDILASYSNSNNTAIEAPTMFPLESFPSTRANFSFTFSNNHDFYVYGGEYYNGVENIVYPDLLKYSSDQNQWKQILSPVMPPARCAHSCVFYNQTLYVFGGELATATQFHHYRDFWKFNISKQTWEEIKTKNNGPSPRSGHRCIVWRHYMILYGGFYEALKETKWFNDLWVFDFATNTWTEQKYSKLSTIPEPRSAFSFAIHTSSDTAILYGGFSKLKNPGKSDETKVHSDCWALHLKPLTQNKVPTWDRLKRKGTFPNPSRSGMGCIVHKQRLLVYGGVNDTEKDGHKLESIFYDTMFAMDMEKKRWFEVGIKKKKSKDGRRRKKKGKDDGDNNIDQDEAQTQRDDEDDEEDDFENDEIDAEAHNGWDFDKLRSNMFAFIDGDGNLVYEKIEEEVDETEDNENEENKGYEADQGERDDKGKGNASSKQLANELMDSLKISEPETKPLNEAETLSPPAQSITEMKVKSNGPIDSSRILKLNSDGKPSAIETASPLPRINAAMAVKNNTLYIFGGLLEVGDREITLDDLWSIDLQKREEWSCIWRGSMHQQVWKGVDSDLDNASYISTGDDRMEDIDEDSDEAGFSAGAAGAASNMSADQIEEERARKDARKAAKREARKKEKSSIRNEIAALRSELQLDDVHRTPQMGEVMADFYSRTSEYWNQQAIASQAAVTTENSAREEERLSHKEMKRVGFSLAQKRYEELKPAIERLNELEEMQAQAETKHKKKKDKDKGQKKEKNKDRRR